MKAIQVTHFAEDNNVVFTEDAAVPPPLARNSSQVRIRVTASALNFGDMRLLTGSLSLVLTPKQFPYTLALDICGVIEDVGDKCQGLAKGDHVVGWLTPMEQGGLAEYVVCDAKQVTKAPASMSAIDAASLITAGCTALQAVKDAQVKAGAKIIVLGGSSGIGSLVVQIARHYGASFIAATSTNTALVQSLGADRVIDYRHVNWWDELADQDLDVVIDCVGSPSSWQHCDRALAKRGGKYIAIVDSPDMQVRSVMDLVYLIAPLLARSWNPFTTYYKVVRCLPTGEQIAQVMALAEQGAIHPVLDPATPLPFNQEGAETAVAIQKSHRAKGKLVFAVASA